MVTTVPVSIELRRMHRFFDDFRGAYIGAHWGKVGSPSLETQSLLGICVIDAGEAIRFHDGTNLTELFSKNVPLILFVKLKNTYSSYDTWVCLADDDPTSAANGFGFKTAGGSWYGFTKGGGESTISLLTSSGTYYCLVAEYIPDQHVRFWKGSFGNLVYVGDLTSNLPTTAIAPWCESDVDGLKIDYYGVLEVVT